MKGGGNYHKDVKGSDSKDDGGWLLHDLPTVFFKSINTNAKLQVHW